MTSFIRISKVAAAVMAVCALLASSCDKAEPEVSLSVKAQYEAVAAKADQMFVSIKCSSSWIATLADGEDGSPVDWATLNVTEGEGDRNLILSYGVNTDEADSRKLTITVTSGKKSVSTTIEQYPAGVRPVDPDEPDGSLKASTAWMELPALDNSALEYYTHSFKMNGNTYRNYSFGWSQDDRIAIWVAYPLCKLYTNGNVGRTQAWALDPLLGDNSSAPFGGYCGSYARGHQLPSADRQCCYEANAQTFYGTNMTPQLNAHNEGIWAELESKVRNIANGSDTTYVVTGVIVSRSSKTEEDSFGKSVTVPDAYFKALLRYSRSSTLGQWNAAAFYLEHRSYSGGINKSHSMSIDELEELTGIDFFVNLPAKIGAEQAAKIEAVDPAESSVWW